MTLYSTTRLSLRNTRKEGLMLLMTIGDYQSFALVPLYKERLDLVRLGLLHCFTQ